ncbi:hypothetical protein OY671_011285, partial [Metschnikowia pulcherrima]
SSSSTAVGWEGRSAMNRLAILVLSSASFSAAGQAQTYEQKIDAAMKRVDAVIAKGPYQANWASSEKFQVPTWYADAKFGIFIHWGVYSVPGFGNEWYPREMYSQDGKNKIFQQHVQKYGPQSKFGYKDFIPMFKAEKYDPQAWATLFKKS